MIYTFKKKITLFIKYKYNIFLINPSPVLNQSITFSIYVASKMV